MNLDTVKNLLNKDCFCHNSQDVKYIIECLPSSIYTSVDLDAHCFHHQHEAVKDLLNKVQSFFKNEALFKVGDRVELTKAPEINVIDAPGWMTSRHILVKGAKGTIQNVSYYQNTFVYGVSFDNETTWIDEKYVIHERAQKDRHVYAFGESYLRKQDTQTVCSFLRGLWHEFYAKRGD